MPYDIVVCRIVQIILEQNYEREQPMLSKVIRVYAPYWFEIARCPPLTLRFIDMGGKKSTRKFALPFHSKKGNGNFFEEIAEEELYDGHTIASALNFNILGLSVSSSGEGHFGPVKDLSLLGDMVCLTCTETLFVLFWREYPHLVFLLVLRMDHWILMPMMLMGSA